MKKKIAIITARVHDYLIERLTVHGYEIVNKQAPTSEWATSARDDLVAAYKAMGRPDDARSIELRRPR